MSGPDWPASSGIALSRLVLEGPCRTRPQPRACDRASPEANPWGIDHGTSSLKDRSSGVVVLPVQAEQHGAFVCAHPSVSEEDCDSGAGSKSADSDPVQEDPRRCPMLAVGRFCGVRSLPIQMHPRPQSAANYGIVAGQGQRSTDEQSRDMLKPAYVSVREPRRTATAPRVTRPRTTTAVTSDAACSLASDGSVSATRSAGPARLEDKIMSRTVPDPRHLGKTRRPLSSSLVSCIHLTGTWTATMRAG
jgi:hypothetical protein